MSDPYAPAYDEDELEILDDAPSQDDLYDRLKDERALYGARLAWEAHYG